MSKEKFLRNEPHGMLGYINTLRSMSQGRVQYMMQFNHCKPVPAIGTAKVKAELGV